MLGAGARAPNRLLAASWANFSVFWSVQRGTKKTWFFGIAPKEQKSHNQWPKVTPGIILGPIFSDFGATLTYFFNFLGYRFCIVFSLIVDTWYLFETLQIYKITFLLQTCSKNQGFASLNPNRFFNDFHLTITLFFCLNSHRILIHFHGFSRTVPRRHF